MSYYQESAIAPIQHSPTVEHSIFEASVCTTMPASTTTHASDNSSPYRIANELSLHKDRPLLVTQKRRSTTPSTFELPPSPAESELDETMPISPEMTKEELRLTKPINRGAPGDQAIFSELKTPEQREVARKKSQYYNDVFAHREPMSSARERIFRDSIIMADVKTNVIVSRPSMLQVMY